MATKKNKAKHNSENTIAEKRIRYYIQLLDVKRDTNMTRIFSAIAASDFFSSPPLQHQYNTQV